MGRKSRVEPKSNTRMAELNTKKESPRSWRRFIPQPLRVFYRQFPLVFSYPKDKIEESAVNYDEYWKEKRGKNLGELSPFQLARAKEVRQLLEPKCSVLDIGCGDGAVLKYIKHELGVIPWGADQSNYALRAAESFGVRTLHLNLNDPDSIEKFPEVDYIMALEVLEHLPNPESLLRALAPKCKKAFVISVPNSGYWLHRLRFLCGRVPAQWRRHPGEHLRFWTLKDLKWWVSAIGWELKELRPYEGMLGLNRLFPSWCGMGVVMKIAPQE